MYNLLRLSRANGLFGSNFTAFSQSISNLMLAQWRSSFDLPLITSLLPRIAGSYTPTFTRASTVYQTDFEGKLNLVPSGATREQGARYIRNLLTYTEDFSNAAWTKTGTATVTGTNQLNFPAENDYVFQSMATTIGNTLVYQVTLSGSGTVSILFSNGGTEVVITLSSTPTIYSISWVSTAANPNVYVFRRPGNTATVVTATKAQVEDVTGQVNQNPSEYVSVDVLSAPWHGAGVDGVKYFSTLNGNTVASNVVTEATGAAIDSSQGACAGGVTAGVVDATGPVGLLTEPAQTDVLGTTAAIRRTMTDVGWVSGGGGITVGAATGADGVPSAAASLTAAGANGTLLFTTVLGAAVRTYSARVRRKTGTGTINITGDNGVAWTPITLTTTYKPFSFTTASAANPIVGFRVVTSADAIEVDFNTLVAGSIAFDEPAPVNVNTVASVAQYVSAGNLSATAITIAMEITPSTALGSASVFHFGTFVDASNYTAIISDGTNLIARKRIAGVNTDATIAFTRTAGTTVKVAARFDTVNGIDVWLNGTKGTPDTTTTASQIGTNFQIGADGNGANQDYCEHRNEKIWIRSLSDNTCANLTS